MSLTFQPDVLYGTYVRLSENIDYNFPPCPEGIVKFHIDKFSLIRTYEHTYVRMEGFNYTT